MQLIDLGLRYEPTPLGACLALALSRMLVQVEPQRSAELAAHARDMAFTAGLNSTDRTRVPILLTDEPELRREFQHGARIAEEGDAFIAQNPPETWTRAGMGSSASVH